MPAVKVHLEALEKVGLPQKVAIRRKGKVQALSVNSHVSDALFFS